MPAQAVPLKAGPPGCAPLAQSAERLHGKNPARNGVLTCDNPSQRQALCSELDALSLTICKASVTSITLWTRWYVARVTHYLYRLFRGYFGLVFSLPRP